MTESNLWHGGTHLQDYGRHDWIKFVTWWYTFAGLWQTCLNHNVDLVLHICRNMANMTKLQRPLGELHTLKSFAALAVLCLTTGSGDRETVPRWRDGPVESTPPATRHSQHGVWNSWKQGREKQSYCWHLLLWHRTTISSMLSFLQKTYVLPFPPSMKTNWTKLDWGELVSLSRETQLCTPRDNIHHHLTNHTSAVTFFGPSKTQEGACYTSTTNEQHLSGSATMQQQWHESPKPCSTLQTGCDKWLNMLKKGRVRVTGAPCRWWRWFHSRPCPPWPRGSGCHPARQTWTQKARQTGLTCHQERECSTHKSQAVPTHFKDSIIKYCFAAWKRGLPWKCACCILS